MRSAFLKMLWSGRERKPNPALQENLARYSMYPPHRNVVAAPVKPPVKKASRRA